MSHIKARFLDTNKILQVEGVWEKGLSKGDLIVVQSDKGEEVVRVIGISKEEAPLRAFFLRRVKEEDLKKLEENKIKEREAEEICRDKVKEHKLDMKLLKAYIPLDGSKIFFYYTSDQRVDFRNLVRDLAKIFKKRIEMRQVGVRDAVQMMGWIGSCGELPCCVRFQEEFLSVSLKDIEEQNLPLSPQKFTGPCGRLMCCLVFERDNYLIKAILPEVGGEICFQGKVYKVEYIDPIKWRIILTSEESRREISLEEILPYGYEKAIQNCKECDSCCKRTIENEAFAGFEQ